MTFASTCTKLLTASSLSMLAFFSSAPIAHAQVQGACSSFYSAGFTLTQGKVNPAVVALAKPAKGVVVKEPNFNTCLVRATDHRPEDRTAGWTYYVPADRVAELTYPDPDAELIEAMAQALYEGGWDDADEAARTHHRHAAERALATVRHHDEARP